MMDELRYRYRELENSLDKLGKRVLTLHKINDVNKKREMHQKLASDAASLKRDLVHVEQLRKNLSNQSQRNIWKPKVSSCKDSIDTIKRDLMKAQTKTIASQGKKTSANRQSHLEMMGKGRQMMNETNDRADNALRLIAEADMKGADTNAKLQNQRSQLERINDEVHIAGDDLKQADRTVRRMIRRNRIDKCIWCLVLLIVLVIIGIVLLKIKKSS